jgi:hypothetical protein
VISDTEKLRPSTKAAMTRINCKSGKPTREVDAMD